MVKNSYSGSHSLPRTEVVCFGGQGFAPGSDTIPLRESNNDLGLHVICVFGDSYQHP